MSIRTKYFPRDTCVNNEQIAAMNTALVNELEQGEKPASMIAAKNRTCEFFIQIAKLKNLNVITCMGSHGLNYQKSMQFLNVNHKHV